MKFQLLPFFRFSLLTSHSPPSSSRGVNSSESSYSLWTSPFTKHFSKPRISSSKMLKRKFFAELKARSTLLYFHPITLFSLYIILLFLLSWDTSYHTAHLQKSDENSPKRFEPPITVHHFLIDWINCKMSLQHISARNTRNAKYQRWTKTQGTYTCMIKKWYGSMKIILKIYSFLGHEILVQNQ